MAKATLKMPDDFLMKLSRLGEKTDEIIPRVLKAGGEVVEAKVKSNLQSVIGNGTKEDSRSTGELVSALGVSSARDKTGTVISTSRSAFQSLAGMAKAMLWLQVFWNMANTDSRLNLF